MSRPSGNRETPASTGSTTPDGATPRWVKVFALVALLVVVLFVILVLSGRGGGHGPSRHGAPAVQLRWQ